MKIAIDLTAKKLNYTDAKGVVQLETTVVQGCEGSSPAGSFQSGKWVKDKTNPKYGPIPWSKSNWGNPYGPYFLEILTMGGAYTSFGIHGTRGPGWSPLATPPVPQGILSWFVDEDDAKHLYCSHGCLRISNSDIVSLFNLTLNYHSKHIPIAITK